MKPRKILVVEDQKVTQEFICDVLRSAGYEVFSATNVSTAVSLARAEEPDLITLDINLAVDSPDDAWDGLTMAAWLKHLNPTKPPIIIVISGTQDPGKAIEKAVGAGVHTFLAKPVERQKLLKLVAELLTQPSLSS